MSLVIIHNVHVLFLVMEIINEVKKIMLLVAFSFNCRFNLKIVLPYSTWVGKKNEAQSCLQ